MSALLHLLNRDGLTLPQLERIYLASQSSPTFTAEALRAVRQLDSDYSRHAVWLLYRHARERPLQEGDLVKLATYADELTHWVARLNLCQLFSSTGCPAAARESLFPFLVECFADPRVIVRAWSISALQRFADDPVYQKQIAALLREAQADRRPSMQARLRRLEGKPRQRLERGAKVNRGQPLRAGSETGR